MVFLISSLDKKIGMGHFARCNYVSDAMQNRGIQVTHLSLITEEELDQSYLLKIFGDTPCNNVLIFDLHDVHINEELKKIFFELKKNNNFLIGLDCLIELSACLDYLWIPTLFIDQDVLKKIQCDYCYGLESILLPKIQAKKHRSDRNNKFLTICSGASDVSFLGDWLIDAILESNLKGISKIIWIQGPYANEPRFTSPKDALMDIEIIKFPLSLISILQQSDFILSVYGITAFEALACRVPSLIFSPYGIKDNENLNALKDLGICDVSLDIKMLATDIKNFIENSKLHLDIRYNLEKIDFSTGLNQFVELVSTKLKQ